MTDVTRMLEDAIARHRAGDLDAAAAGYEAVLAQDAREFDALHLRGVIAMQRNDAARAVDLFARAVEVAPGNAAAREAYARALHAQGRLAEAAAQFEALAAIPSHAVTGCVNLGSTLWALERYGEALAAFDRALALDPANPDALFNSAVALELTGSVMEALARMQRLLAQRPRNARAYYQAGLLFHAQGMRVEALQAFADALQLDEDFAEARWMLAIAQLPLAYGPGERHDGDIARFDAAVSELDAWFTGSRVALAERALATRQPFYIAYQDADIRPSLDRYGDLCVRLMTQSHGHAVVARRERPRPVRVAVVSRFFYDHAVWTALLRGWCSRVDRSRIELHFLHTGTHDDAHTALARSTAASFTRGPRSVGQWMEVMRDIAPDIAIYPEVCMDAMSLRLACVRPAPVQVTTWGHPMTSGLSTIDHFLSAQAFEPDGAQAHYRERLVELPGIGCYYDRLAPDELAGDASILGPRTRPRFACVGTPYKYLPQHDHLLVDIAGRVGDCEFLFFVDMAPLLSRKVEDRLALAFAQRGLEAKRFLRFLPRQTRPTFFAILRACDAYLDTPVFSGFNTAMQAVECGLPIVTLEGRYLRGRFASGILGEMGVGDVVAHDDEQYVATAARLATDPRYRDSICARMEAGSRRVFCNEAPVRALEDFLAGLASRGAD